MASATLKNKANKNQDQSKMENQTDPLNESFEDVSTSFPLLEDNNYDLLCKESEIMKSAAGDPMLKLQLTTTAVARSRTGEDMVPGAATVFHTCSLVPTGKATIDMVRRNVGAVIQAAGLTQAEMGPPPWTSQLETLKNGQWHAAFKGRVLRCKVGYEKEGVSSKGRSFPAKNVIDQFIKK